MKEEKSQRSAGRRRSPLLRRRSELLRADVSDLSAMSPIDAQRLVHALQVQQVELELQNEELRRAQLELAESRDRYIDLYEFGPVGYATLDDKKRIVESNLRCAVMLDISRKDLVGQSIFRFVAPESRDTCYLYLRDLFAGNTGKVCKLDMLRKDGTTFSVRLESIVQTQANTAGRFCRIAIVDMPGPPRPADSNSEKRLLAILKAAPDAIITTDGGGTIIQANSASDRMFGYAMNQLVGLNIRRLIPEREDRQIGEERTIESGETTAFRKDGSTFPADIAVSQAEGLDLFTYIILDVSARKRAEQERDQYRKDLQAMAWELMLTEERQRQQLARDLHDSVGQSLFLLRMHLDKRLTIGDADSDEVCRILVDMAKAVNSLVFELSPPVLQQLGFRSAMHWLADYMKRRYTLSVRIDDDNRSIPLDEETALVLFRSTRELLVNVWKHAQADTASLSIRRSHGRLQVTIEDQGRGFNPHQSHHVGDGHFGLFSIHERIKYLGGNLLIRSKPGGGTKVTLTVPIAAAKVAPAAGK